MFFKFIIHNTDKNSSSFNFVFFATIVKLSTGKGSWVSVHSLQLIKIRVVHKKSSGRGSTPFFSSPMSCSATGIFFPLFVCFKNNFTHGSDVGRRFLRRFLLNPKKKKKVQPRKIRKWRV